MGVGVAVDGECFGDSDVEVASGVGDVVGEVLDFVIEGERLE